MQEFKRIIDQKVFLVPTKVSILQGYDFQRDIKGILPALKGTIVGKSIEEARKLILSYPEIASTKINLGLLGGTTLPSIKSRIDVEVEF